MCGYAAHLYVGQLHPLEAIDRLCSLTDYAGHADWVAPPRQTHACLLMAAECVLLEESNTAEFITYRAVMLSSCCQCKPCVSWHAALISPNSEDQQLRTGENSCRLERPAGASSAMLLQRALAFDCCERTGIEQKVDRANCVNCARVLVFRINQAQRARSDYVILGTRPHILASFQPPCRLARKSLPHMKTSPSLRILLTCQQNVTKHDTA